MYTLHIYIGEHRNKYTIESECLTTLKKIAKDLKKNTWWKGGFVSKGINVIKRYDEYKTKKKSNRTSPGNHGK